MDFLPIPSKPILVVYVPPDWWHQSSELLERTTAQLPDYHIFVCPTNNPETTFEAFYAKDFNITDFERFQRLILERIDAPLPVRDAFYYPDPVLGA